VPIGFALRNYFFRAGMLSIRFLQIECVKGLIHDNGVGPIFPSPHHCGRDVARSRPHRDAETSRFDLSHGVNVVSEKRNYEAAIITAQEVNTQS
jgi:hypothetical protein